MERVNKKMKTIAIITMHAVKNYGSVLQTLATQKLFQLHGLKPVIIDYRRPWDTGLSYYCDIKGKGIKGAIKQLVYLPSKIKQKKVFERFLSTYINLTEHEYNTLEDFSKYPCEADIFCTGSDQVWNSGWNRGIKEAFYLPFVPSEKKKVSYASSIGKEIVEEHEKKKIAEYLKSYDDISVREKTSGTLLKSMGLNNVDLVLDPTLQLSRTEWEKIINTHKISEKNYVLIIQLNRNKNFDNFAIKFAKKHGKRLLRLCLRVDQAVLPGKAVVIPEVSDYLGLIANADYILTDSFHAVSFCINFEKNFYAILPEKYSSRIRSILEDLQLTNRIVQDYNLKENQLNDIQYKDVRVLLESMRKSSSNYLDRICKD